MSEYQTQVKEIREEINSIGPILPGGISEQWYTCRKKGCKCMDAKNPSKHGPYYQLSFSISGKSSTMIVKEENLEKAKKYIANNKRLKKLNVELLRANVALLKAEGFDAI